MNKNHLRGILFRHLDGLATLPVVAVLSESKILEYIDNKKSSSLKDLSGRFQTNAGYLNVALRTLASQGFLDYKTDHEVYIQTKDAFSILLKYAKSLEPVFELLLKTQKYHPRNFEKEAFLLIQPFLKKHTEDTLLEAADSDEERAVRIQIKYYIEGCLIGPTIVRLGMSGMFHKYFMESSFKAEEFHRDAECFSQLLDFFVYLNWFQKKNESYQFTDTGLFFAKRASAYGVTVSYLPLLTQMKNLLFERPFSLRKDHKGEIESHVDREMNVWGSGGAHLTYFKVLDEIIIEIFNRPLEQQPKGILDMGCGNGALLHHLYDTIENQTLRGQYLDSHPLFLVGADYNQAALRVSRKHLIDNDIWAKMIWGDIGNPKQLAEDLEADYSIQLKDLLNIRTFLDHNRIWEAPKIVENLNISTSTGAFSYRGEKLKNEWVEQSLVEHLKKWKSYVDTFGLIIIELHTLDPELTAAHLGKTAATAYDATHGFSDQYILEMDLFTSCAKRAGLEVDMDFFKKFPNNELANISIQLLK